MTKEFFQPLMETFMQVLPHTYRNTEAPDGTCIRIIVTTEIGGSWQLTRKKNVWELTTGDNEPQTIISIDPDTTWKLFTKGISAAEAEGRIHISGKLEWGKPLLVMRAVMA